MSGKGRAEGETERERGKEEQRELKVIMHVCGNPYIAVWQQRSARQ